MSFSFEEESAPRVPALVWQVAAGVFVGLFAWSVLGLILYGIYYLVS